MVHAPPGRRFLAPAAQKILRVSGAFRAKILEKSRCARLWTHPSDRPKSGVDEWRRGISPPPLRWVFRYVTAICNGHRPLRNGACARAAGEETLRNGACPSKSCFLNARDQVYERKVVLAREQQGTNWRHGSPAESGLSRACRPWPTGGRQTTKTAVSVKVYADGPRLLALAVPVNQRTVPGGPGGDFYGRRAHGRARCRADGIPGGGRLSVKFR